MAKETPQEWRERIGLGPGIASAGTPSRRPHEARSAEKEKEWGRDHAAYRRLRKDGLQPDKIDGSAELETRLP